jgi:hypothetical protein
MKQLTRLFEELERRHVRYAAMGVWGANHYARSPAGVVSTQDTDLFLPQDPGNLIEAWTAAETVGLELWSGAEPLDRPRDLVLARAVVSRRALTRAFGEDELIVDFSLVMGSFEFEQIWPSRKRFSIEGVDVVVASLLHIVQSKAAAGRLKDIAYLATLDEELRQLGYLPPRSPGM